MPVKGSNNTSGDKFNQKDLIAAISSLSDIILILNADGIYTYIALPNTSVIQIDPKASLNKHFRDIYISDSFVKNLEKKLAKIQKNSVNEEFEFTVNSNLEEIFFKARIAILQSDTDEVRGYIIFASNLTDYKLKENELLEQKAKIIELEKEADFYIKQGDKIAEQKYKIKKQHDLVRQQNKKIEDSILYAKRIQSAVLPPSRFIKHLLTEHFILYKPRDIVSGDFYWIKQFDEKIFIAAADCTGHGVPGALMSMLGITFLNEIINKNPDVHANEILNELRLHIISSLRQTGSSGENRDGLDIAICVINHKNKVMEYAGANNPLYLIRNNEFSEIKADRMPVGFHRRSKDSFTNHNIKLKKDDLVYIFSDGFADQFGGVDGRKFMSSNFKKLLLDNYSKSLDEQKLILEKTFEEWKGERKQLDDILVIGFKIAFEKDDVKSKLDYDWKGKTVLIAEDDESNFFLLKTALLKTNIKVIHAVNGKEAIRLCKLHPEIDVVLMDIRMPVMDGIEATGQIKDFNKDIPIIVQTAYSMSTEKEKSFKAGCDDYISKPIILKELFATMSKYIEK